MAYLIYHHMANQFYSRMTPQSHMQNRTLTICLLKYLNLLNSVPGVIKRLGNRVDTSVIISIHYSLVQSHLSYLTPAFGIPASKNHLAALQVAQNVAIRAIFAPYYFYLNLSTNDIHQKYKILNVDQVIEFNLGVNVQAGPQLIKNKK